MGFAGRRGYIGHTGIGLISLAALAADTIVRTHEEVHAKAEAKAAEPEHPTSVPIRSRQQRRWAERQRAKQFD